MFDVQSRKEGDVCVLTVQGSLKYENLPVLRETVRGINAEQNPQILVINLEGVAFIDSSGIGLLVACHNVMNKKQGSLRLCGMGSHIEHVLKSVNLSSLFSVFHSEKEALLGSLA
jgi:anti-sigma B factor antagonist